MLVTAQSEAENDSGKVEKLHAAHGVNLVSLGRLNEKSDVLVRVV